jgi:ATP-dependent exoDNAse (exonuclease V) beta subunit
MSPSAPQLLELDAQARHAALDVHRSLLLQAPAGSGKTTVLTARFLALLAVADAPEQILAITFTRKAAAEMRRRILEALRAAEQGEEIRGIDSSLLRGALDRDRERGWQLRRNPARLRIETIDALCYRLASALPIAARGGARLEITTTPVPLYRRAARSALRGALEQPGGAAAVRLLLDRLDNRWLRVERLLAGMLAKRSHWLPRVLAAHAAGLGQRVAESLDSVLRGQLARAAAQLPAASLRAAERWLARCEPGTRPVLDADPANLRHWRTLSELTITKEDQWRQRALPPKDVRRDDPLLTQDIRDWIDELRINRPVLEALCDVRVLPEAQLGADELEALSALTSLLTVAAAELQLLFAEQGRVDYAYVASAARQALSEQGEPTDLALRASAELRHILLDEFQDTSFDQFELLRALTASWERGDGRTLFIVGDPMQSIYQFREAEVGLFLRARDRGVGEISFEMLQLRRNFRSRAALIEWVNRHFEQLFPIEDDARLAAVRYLSSAAVAADPAGAEAPVHLHRLAAGDRAGEAVRVLAIIRQARTQNPACSVAVLVAAREHAALIVAELRAAGFALRGVDLEPLRDRPTVRDLSAVARALLHGADRTAWLSLLRAPWCGLTLSSLLQIMPGNRADCFETLRNFARAGGDDALRVARLCDALEPALFGPERGWPLWQQVERCWLRLGGPAVHPEQVDLLDARRFIDALAMHDDIDSLVGDGMAALTEPLYSAAPPQPGAIDVMTIHAAKGLEWDVVILPGLDSRGAPDSDPLLHWIELPRAEGTDLLLAPIRSSDTAADGLLPAYIKQLRRARLTLERTRQLYVAVTRARCSLHLLAAIDAGGDGQEPPKPVSGSLLAVLWRAVEKEFQAAGSNQPPAAPAAATLARPPPLLRVPAGWLVPQSPPAPIAQRFRVGAEEEDQTPEYSWVGLTARAIGTVVHGELRRLAGLAQLPQPGQFSSTGADYAGWLAELGVPLAEQPAATALIRQAIERTLADPRGRWLLAADHPLTASEWRLSGLHDGRMVNVIFDRMLVDVQGQRWIIDYKTSRHEGGSLQQFVEREAERYTPQLRRYAALARQLGPGDVRVALYFPLLGVFQELPV